LLRHRFTLLTVVLAAAVGLLSRCVHLPATPPDPRGQAFTATATCLNCHRDITNDYLHTAHADTAQNYISWKGDTAYHQDRPVSISCFECHSSFIKNKAGQAPGFHHIDLFDRSSLVAGIDCQRCHGPAAQHATWHTGHPNEKKARFITPMDSLNRQQRLDVCAVCHSGIHPEQHSLFRFRPGHLLSNYYSAALDRYPDTDTLDVHANQYQLLASSRCYLESTTLVCSTCHNPHKTERASLAVFAQRCQSCHNPLPQHPGVDKTLIETKCIDCHMPKRPSIRTHHIAIYR